MTRIVTHRVDHRGDPPMVELPESLHELRDQHGTLGLIGFLAQLEANDAARFRARLEPTPAADAAQLAAALHAFLAQATRWAGSTPGTNRVGARTALTWVQK